MQLSEEIARREKEREEMEKVRLDLYLEEQEEKERQKEMVSFLFKFTVMCTLAVSFCGPIGQIHYAVFALVPT